MKKRITVLLLLVVVVVMGLLLWKCVSENKILEENILELEKQISNANKKPPEDAIIQTAITEVADVWMDLYKEANIDSDYLQIKNTRIITLKDNAVDVWYAFDGITYIVEFELYSDYFGTEAYPIDANYMDCVAVYTDGTMTVLPKNLLEVYRINTYSSDYTDIIEEIKDYEDLYNQEISFD